MVRVVVNISDLTDPRDPEGRSFRQVDRAKKHSIKVGSLVECENGVRLWVAEQIRDCDGTPLYCLCADRDDTIPHKKGFANRKWHCGYLEESLKVIKETP